MAFARTAVNTKIQIMVKENIKNLELIFACTAVKEAIKMPE